MTDAELERRLTELSRDDSRRFDAVAKLIAQFAERVDARFESLNARLDILETSTDVLRPAAMAWSSRCERFIKRPAIMNGR